MVQAKSICVSIRFPSVLLVVDLRKLKRYKIEHRLKKTHLISLNGTFIPSHVRFSFFLHYLTLTRPCKENLRFQPDGLVTAQNCSGSGVGECD